MNKVYSAPYGVEMATVMARGAATGAHGASDFVSALVRLPVTLFKVLLTWQERSVERNRMRHLDDRLLDDMGLTRADVARQSSIPFWRAS